MLGKSFVWFGLVLGFEKKRTKLVLKYPELNQNKSLSY